MADKQNRYRQRKTDQGLKRVEVLVPSGSVPHLKAYARALRDASQLGFAAPLFDGLRREQVDASPDVKTPPTLKSERNTHHPRVRDTVRKSRPKGFFDP